MIPTPPVEPGTAEAQSLSNQDGVVQPASGSGWQRAAVHRRPGPAPVFLRLALSHCPKGGIHHSVYAHLWRVLGQRSYHLSPVSPSKHSPLAFHVSYVNVWVRSVISVVGLRQDFPVYFRLELAL